MAMRVLERDAVGRIMAFPMTRPDDWHLHVRDGAAMACVLLDSARRFGRAIIMPNLKDNSVITVALAAAYRQRILDTLPAGSAFEPLMTLYLTDNTPPEEIDRLKESGFVYAVKLYPAGATTNSAAGVTDISHCHKTLERMERHGVPLLVHGEVTDPTVDIFDREAVFINRVLEPLLRDHPDLRAVMEHITTRDGVQFVLGSGPNVAATITAHHLLLNRNAIFQGGIRSHHYCLPVLKREEHRKALLLDAATSGNPKFFLGTDSAPHGRRTKECACGCAGCFTAHAGIELYAEAFDLVGALDKLEGFASHFGADFYGLPRNTDRIMFVRESWTVPKELPYADGDVLVPLRAGELVQWKMKGLDYPS